MARQLIEVGYHGKGEVLTREQFDQKKIAYQQAKKNKNKASVKAYAHQGLPIEGHPFLEELAERETHLRNGRMTTILFIRCKNKAGNEISGYIDLAHRMKTENFRNVFQQDETIVPKPSDLSFFSWESQVCYINDSPNFRTDASSEEGLMFRNKRDRKLINVNPAAATPGDGTDRKTVVCPQYIQVVFFDHMTRRKHWICLK